MSVVATDLAAMLVSAARERVSVPVPFFVAANVARLLKFTKPN